MFADRIESIPTRYNGVEFRSLLEARWACVFDLLGLKWEYEPLELGGDPVGTGFIPDFLLDVPLYAGPDQEPVRPLLVEVKPVIQPEDYREPIAKIARSGWSGAAMVLGCVVREREFMVDEAEYWCGYAHPAVRSFHAEPVSNDWFQAGFQRKDEFDKGMFAFGGTFNLVPFWRESSNRTRWKPQKWTF